MQSCHTIMIVVLIYHLMLPSLMLFTLYVQTDASEETTGDCILPIHVREVARRFLTTSGVFTIGQRSQVLQKPFMKRLIAL